jgi:hypothetical protein
VRVAFRRTLRQEAGQVAALCDVALVLRDSITAPKKEWNRSSGFP